jgi:predicted nucleic acid-binding protein
MATINPKDEVFLDASYALALSAPTDQYHGCALLLAEELKTAKARLVTTRAVLLEIGNALSRQRYRTAAVSLLRALETDSSVEVLPLSEDLYARAFALFAARPDKEWGLRNRAKITYRTL